LGIVKEVLVSPPERVREKSRKSRYARETSKCADKQASISTTLHQPSIVQSIEKEGARSGWRRGRMGKRLGGVMRAGSSDVRFVYPFAVAEIQERSEERP
tara:strand:+ start:267 stop:566 length:300 start_codon:yes stop_codon:yes gene_type:complete